VYEHPGSAWIAEELARLTPFALRILHWSMRSSGEDPHVYYTAPLASHDFPELGRSHR